MSAASAAVSGRRTGLVQPHRASSQSCAAPTNRLDQHAAATKALPVMAATWDGLRVNGCRGERGQCTRDTCVPRAASTVQREPQTVHGIETKEWKRNAAFRLLLQQSTKTDAGAVPVRLAGKGACEWARRCASKATPARWPPPPSTS